VFSSPGNEESQCEMSKMWETASWNITTRRSSKSNSSPTPVANRNVSKITWN
jgi:hypothetical protein